jgi:hypothetical protein
MQRTLLLTGALALAGCQSQSPYAVIGPPTVPAPRSAQAPPYYPPLAGGGAPALPASTRPSVSVDRQSELAASPGALSAEPADREPLRIVENPAAAARTAAAPGKPNVPSAAAVPAPLPVPGSGTPAFSPAGKSPAAGAPAKSSSSFLPPGVNRLRGYHAAPASAPPTGVVPAGYQQPLPAFAEPAAGAGQWKPR